MSNNVDPNAPGWDLFKSLPRDEPIHMLNLIRVKAKAEYAADHPDHGKAKSGLEAYKDYSKNSGPVFRRVGGTVVWSGSPQAVVIGPEDERWDLAFIAEYPNSAAFLEMISDPAYKEAVKHRTAAVEDSRLIRMAPAPSGEGFG